MSTRGRLIVNPNIRVEPVYEDGQIRSIRIWAPIRTKSLKYNEIDAAHYQLAFDKLVSALSSPEGLSNAVVAEAIELRDLGVLIYPDQVSDPVKFEIPAGSSPGLSAPRFPLAIGEEDLKSFTGAISYRGDLVWHQSNEISVINPWATFDEPSLPAEAREDVPEPQAGFISAASEAARRFATHGYATVRLDLPLAQLSALQRYYENLIANGWLSLGDEQSNRYHGHNDPVAVMLQWRVLPLIKFVTRAKIMPSYAYAIRYGRGAELPKHTDRPQCKYTVALLLDLDGAEVAGVSPWPLTLHPSGAGESGVDIHQTIGQALMYYGQTIPHSRVPLDSCQSSTSLLLHYVDEDFSGTLF